MPSHVNKISFAGMRRLNAHNSYVPAALNFGKPFPRLRKGKYWYHFSMVNVFIGANGGGKSTVLELVETLGAPERLCTLPREMPETDADTGFILQSSNSVRVECQCWPIAQSQWLLSSNTNSVDANGVFLHIYEDVQPRKPHLHKSGWNLKKSGLEGEEREKLLAALSLLDCKVERWNSDAELSSRQLVEILNSEAGNLLGVFNGASEDNVGNAELFCTYPPAPFYCREDGKIAVWLDDDLAQANRVQIEALPAGWRRFANIMGWLNNVAEGAVCLFEEPEVHLHPRLQRRLAMRMFDIAKNRGLQLFIATHAPAMVDSRVWSHDGEGVAVFEATGARLEKLGNPARMLDALGIRGADICQCNGIIWVEGPSDRLFVKHWLSMWYREQGRLPPREHIDYAFQFYGGAILAHYSATECEEFISMLRLNRNMMLLMDRDDDFVRDADGSWRCLKPQGAKARILSELALADDGSAAWVTEGYTIESELPLSFIDQYYRMEGEKPVPRGSTSKVEMALKYTHIYVNLSEAVRNPSYVNGKVAALAERIEHWAR